MNPETYSQMFACEGSHWWYVGMQRIMSTILENHISWKTKGARVLDVGCGTGGTLEQLNRQTQATGIDLFPQALKYCRQRRLPRLIQASVEALPLRENTFDLVTCFDVLYHQAVVNDVQAISEMVRVLKTGGWLLIREPAYNFLRGSCHDRAVHTGRRYRATKLKQKLESAGLDIDRITYANAFLFPLAAAKRLLESWLPVKNASPLDPDLKLNCLNRLFFKVLRIEANLLKRLDLPLGLSLIVLARK